MKKLMILLLLFSYVGLSQYNLNWKNIDFMVPGDKTRGVAYNPVTDHVLVATRAFGTDIFILDAATGDSIGKMETSGISASGSTYPINLLDVADDGTIYVGNLSSPMFTPGTHFKVYRYADENATPELVFDDALDNKRFGDALEVKGSGTEKYIYASGSGGGDNNENMVVLKDDGGSTLSLLQTITLPQYGNAKHGISPMWPGGWVWVNGAESGNPPGRLLDSDGTVLATIPDSLASPGGTASIEHIYLGKYNVVTVTNAYAITIRSIKYELDPLGFILFDYFGGDSDSSMLFYQGVKQSNGNATSVLDYDFRRNSMITLFGNNSIASVSYEPLVKTSTPRDSANVVSIDGANDFYPSDRVGNSNGRQMYMTWTDGKFFAGITGQTLIDPQLQNYLYLVFDLDPSGTNGSSTPPEDAGGVTTYPVKADVVYSVESWSEPDFMIGKIYKWNGSAWTSTNFDGNLAAQGALASADSGYRKIAEIAAIENANGIGTTFSDLSVIAYVAQQGASGEVLSAFPDGNPLGSGNAFTQYYYINELGSGLFPADTSHVQVIGDPVVGIPEQSQVISGFELKQNYPNPFNPVTKIEYYLPGSAKVNLKIFDITGREVAELVNSKKQAGLHKIDFDASSLSSGVYLYKLSIDNKNIKTRKMVLLK